MKIIYIDPEKCMGCKSCEIACAVAHSQSKNLLQALKESPGPGYRVKVAAVEGMCMPLQCRHCDDAPCVAVCPSKALYKEENGLVLIDHSKCIGCKFCVVVCPFGSIQMDKEGKAVIKCDQCLDRQREGKEPACVAACPTKSLKFIEINKIPGLKAKKFLTEFKK